MSDETPNVPPPFLPALAAKLGMRTDATEQDILAYADERGPVERKLIRTLIERDAYAAHCRRLARRMYLMQRRAAGRTPAAQPGEGKP